MVSSAASPDHSLWSATAAEAVPDAPALQGEHAVDAAIIGGGFTGLSAALNLAEAGARVAVLEAQSIGWGGSGRNGGQVIPGLKLDPSEMVARWGEARGRALTQAVGAAADGVFARIDRHRIACTPRRSGWIQAAHAAPALERVLQRAEEWRAVGARVEIMDAATLAARTGAAGYKGGWCDGRAGTIQPLDYVRGLARAALEAGARLHAGTPVQRLAPERDGWRLQTPRGGLFARAVIVATNAYTDALVPGLARTLLTVQSMQFATDTLPASLCETILPGGECISETRRLAFYFRRSPDDRLIFGGRGAVGDAERGSLFAALRQAARRILPQTTGLSVAYRWSGQVAMTLDGLPRIHEPRPGLFIGLGYNGRGIAMATLMGEWLAARLHAGMEAPLPRTDIRPISWHGARKPAIALGISWAWARDRLGFAA